MQPTRLGAVGRPWWPAATRVASSVVPRLLDKCVHTATPPARGRRRHSRDEESAGTPTLYLRLHDVAPYLLWRRDSAEQQKSAPSSSSSSSSSSSALVELSDVTALLDEQPRDNDGAKRLLSALRSPAAADAEAVSARRIGKRKSGSSVWWMACSFADSETALAVTGDLAPGFAVRCGPHERHARTSLGLFWAREHLRTRDACAHAWVDTGGAREFVEVGGNRVLNSGAVAFSVDSGGQLVVLVFRDKNDSLSCHLGGALDPLIDSSLLDGAIREFHEETYDVWRQKDIARWCPACPPHQFRRIVNQGGTYALFVPFRAASALRDAVETSSSRDAGRIFGDGAAFREVGDFAWVPLDELSHCLSGRNRLFDLSKHEVLAHLQSLDPRVLLRQHQRES
jgi:hypothetical protein